jgi:hypothetical protein
MWRFRGERFRKISFGIAGDRVVITNYIFDQGLALRIFCGGAQGRVAAGRSGDKSPAGCGRSIQAGRKLLFAEVAGFSLDERAVIAFRLRLASC